MNHTLLWSTRKLFSSELFTYSSLEYFHRFVAFCDSGPASRQLQVAVPCGSAIFKRREATGSLERCTCSLDKYNAGKNERHSAYNIKERMLETGLI